MRRKILGALFAMTLSTAAYAAAAVPVPAAMPPGASIPAAVKGGPVKAMVALVGLVEGKAQVLVDGVEPWTEAKVGQRLTAGTQVKTEANAGMTIAFTDGTKLRIGPNATFKIEDVSMSKVGVYIGLGKLDFWVKKLKGRMFQMRNPVAVASVRGTGGTIDVQSPTQVSMMCFEGSLGVTDNFGRSQGVEAGQSLAANAATGASEPPAPIPAGVTAPVEPTVVLPELAAAGEAPATPEAAAPADEVTAEETATETVPGTETTTQTTNPAQETSVTPTTTSCIDCTYVSPSGPDVCCP
ncbi:MAG: FecR domain-containing protein [Elusimicrobia bacterium]|nr:FecR domain-containing protein [Elusimicrobiota bacterium]